MSSDWRTSSYTGGTGNCVEVADTGRAIMIRDTKDLGGVMLTIPADAWQQFTASLK